MATSAANRDVFINCLSTPLIRRFSTPSCSQPSALVSGRVALLKRMMPAKIGSPKSARSSKTAATGLTISQGQKRMAIRPCLGSTCLWNSEYSSERRAMADRHRKTSAASSLNVEDGLGEGLGSFLRQVVADAACDQPVLILAGEFLCIGAGIRVRSTIGGTLESDGRQGDRRECGKPLFEFVVLRLTLRKAEPPAVVVDDDADVIRIIEGCGAAIECGVVEAPFRR